MLAQIKRRHQRSDEAMSLVGTLEKSSAIQISIDRAVNASESRSTNAPDLWRNLYDECKKNGNSFIALLQDRNEGVSAIEKVLISGDWTSVFCLYDLMPQGVFADGHVMRSSDGVYTVADTTPQGPGLCIVCFDCLYIGDFVDGQPHGQGELVYGSGDRYQGDWQKGKWHGWGKVIAKSKFSSSYGGIFVEDRFLGDPRAPKAKSKCRP